MAPKDAEEWDFKFLNEEIVEKYREKVETEVEVEKETRTKNKEAGQRKKGRGKDKRIKSQESR